MKYTLIRWQSKERQDLHKQAMRYVKKKYGKEGMLTPHIVKLLEEDLEKNK